MPKGIWREFENPAQNSSEEKSLNIQSKVDKLVRVQRSRGGRGGKTVTIIAGLDLNDIDLRKLLKKLKTKCGTGGTVKAENIELQGDQIQSAMEFLKKNGFDPKQSGG